MATDVSAELLGGVSSLRQCSVVWVVQKKNDSGHWSDCDSLSSTRKDVAEINMRHECNALITAMSRHRIVRRVTFDFLEPMSGFGE